MEKCSLTHRCKPPTLLLDVQIMAIRLRNRHQLENWPLGSATCIAALLGIVLLASSVIIVEKIVSLMGDQDP